MNTAGVDINVFDQDLNFDESLLYVYSPSRVSRCRDIRLSTFQSHRTFHVRGTWQGTPDPLGQTDCIACLKEMPRG
jgi:hypothetical protein